RSINAQPGQVHQNAGHDDGCNQPPIAAAELLPRLAVGRWKRPKLGSLGGAAVKNLCFSRHLCSGTNAKHWLLDGARWYRKPHRFLITSCPERVPEVAG